MALKTRYKRVLIKISGEALSGEGSFGLDKNASVAIAERIKELYAEGVEIGIVIGGGNIFRGSLAEAFGFARTPADHMGMLATVINGLTLQQALANEGCKTRIMSAHETTPIVETYNWHHAMASLAKGVIVIFVGGTGNPYFTTDSAAALRAVEVNADVLLKATKVEGIYDKDPRKYKDAIKHESLSYSEVLTKKLSVMDATAVALCRENKLPIYVFNLFDKNGLTDAVSTQESGTLVSGD